MDKISRVGPPEATGVVDGASRRQHQHQPLLGPALQRPDPAGLRPVPRPLRAGVEEEEALAQPRAGLLGEQVPGQVPVECPLTTAYSLFKGSTR